jgi:hypothetical protein
VPAEAAGVPSAQPRDAYRCLQGPRWASNELDLVLSDAFGTQAVRKNRLDRLCAPTDLDTSGPPARKRRGPPLRQGLRAAADSGAQGDQGDRSFRHAGAQAVEGGLALRPGARQSELSRRPGLAD